MSVEKNISFGFEGAEKMKRGVDAVANAVKSTMGYKGKNVIIGMMDIKKHNVTKDGVTVAKSIVLPDHQENLGARLIIEASSKTADEAGDGTTCCAVLAQAIITNGMKFVQSGANPISIKKGIDTASFAASEHIKKVAKKIDNNKRLRNIATISANNDAEIGNLIADTFEKIGLDGSIKIELSKTHNTTIEIVNGLELESGMVSPYFITDTEKNECEFVNPYILLYERKIFNLQEVLGLLEAAKEKNRPILLITEGIEMEPLQTLVINKLQGILNVCAVNMSSRYSMEDLACVTGGVFLTEEKGYILSEATLDLMGSAKKVIIGEHKTVIIDGAGSKKGLLDRISHIKSEVSAAKTEFEKGVLRRRIARLKNGVAVLHIGGATETEIKEKYDRVDDSICATRAALEEGYVAGGGVTFLNCAKALRGLKSSNDDEQLGINILIKSLEEPFKQMLANGGIDVGDYIKRIQSSPYGFGLNLKNDKFENLLSAGVIDPAKVCIQSLRNGASVATMFLTTSCVISDINK